MQGRCDPKKTDTPGSLLILVLSFVSSKLTIVSLDDTVAECFDTLNFQESGEAFIFSALNEETSSYGKLEKIGCVCRP